jgi:two-component system response regulator FimZ (fimbrial Z protein)
MRPPPRRVRIAAVSPSVLIVDDHASFRRFARRSLEQAGFEVVGEAADGTTGLTETRRLSPDVVLLDVLLPDVSGLEVARKLAPCPSTRVVLTSSRGAEELGVALDEAEADGFIPKSELSGASLIRLLAA